jgi:hypothetical protein
MAHQSSYKQREAKNAEILEFKKWEKKTLFVERTGEHYSSIFFYFSL